MTRHKLSDRYWQAGKEVKPLAVASLHPIIESALTSILSIDSRLVWSRNPNQPRGSDPKAVTIRFLSPMGTMVVIGNIIGSLAIGVDLRQPDALDRVLAAIRERVALAAEVLEREGRE